MLVMVTWLLTESFAVRALHFSRSLTHDSMSTRNRCANCRHVHWRTFSCSNREESHRLISRRNVFETNFSNYFHSATVWALDERFGSMKFFYGWYPRLFFFDSTYSCLCSVETLDFFVIRFVNVRMMRQRATDTDNSIEAAVLIIF
jgi:hypothetical protein